MHRVHSNRLVNRLQSTLLQHKSLSACNITTYLDFHGIVLRYLPTLHLLRSRNEPTLRRPLIRGQDDTLEDLNRLEAVLLADGVALLHNELAHTVVLAELRERGVRRDAEGLALERVPEVLLVRNNDGDRLLCVGVRVHANVRDKVACLVHGLETLECDVLRNHQSAKSVLASSTHDYLPHRQTASPSS